MTYEQMISESIKLENIILAEHAKWLKGEDNTYCTPTMKAVMNMLAHLRKEMYNYYNSTR
jgi:hypothetical protein